MKNQKKLIEEIIVVRHKISVKQAIINETRRKLYKQHGKHLKTLKERQRTLESKLFGEE